jgi:hypothetical protein
MKLNEPIKIVFRYVSFLIVSFLGTFLLIFISEVTNFSSFDIGGTSWALWSYLLYFLVSFFFFYRIFKLPTKVIFLIIIFFCLLFIWLNIDGGLFENPMPFGFHAY